MDSRNFFGGGGPSSLVPGTWYSLRGRSPAYSFFRKEKIQPHVRGSFCDAESFERVLLRSYFLRRRNYPARKVELFSLRKKRTAGIRLSAWQEEGSLYRLAPLFSALKKALQNYGFQGDLIPLASAREQSSRGLVLPGTPLKQRRKVVNVLRVGVHFAASCWRRGAFLPDAVRRSR